MGTLSVRCRSFAILIGYTAVVIGYTAILIGYTAVPYWLERLGFWREKKLYNKGGTISTLITRHDWYRKWHSYTYSRAQVTHISLHSWSKYGQLCDGRPSFFHNFRLRYSIFDLLGILDTYCPLFLVHKLHQLFPIDNITSCWLHYQHLLMITSRTWLVNDALHRKPSFATEGITKHEHEWRVRTSESFPHFMRKQ